MPSTTATRAIVFLTYEGAQLLDVAGPASVFAEANEFVRKPAYRVIVVSPDGGLVSSRGGVTLATDPVLDIAAARIDTLIVSGGIGAPLLALVSNDAVARWFRRAARHARRVGSTCTGAFVLANWGVLDGRRAATHWQAADRLRTEFPSVTVDADALFVEDGKVWTSAGVSTGIDMALAMVEQDLGRTVVSNVAQRLVLQVRRPGHQSQFSTVLKAQGGTYAELVRWIDMNLQADLSIEALARQANQSVRTFCRRFSEELGASPGAFVERMRLDRARTLLEAGTAAKRVALDTGFGSMDRLWRAFKRVYAINPSTYRAMHRR